MPSIFSRLFGKSAPAAIEPILHKSCRIYPEPIKEGASFRVCARIEKDFGAETKVHDLIRADTHAALTDATEAALGKAKQAIDQLGDALFK